MRSNLFQNIIGKDASEVVKGQLICRRHDLIEKNVEL